MSVADIDLSGFSVGTLTNTFSNWPFPNAMLEFLLTASVVIPCTLICVVLLLLGLLARGVWTGMVIWEHMRMGTGLKDFMFATSTLIFCDDFTADRSKFWFAYYLISIFHSLFYFVFLLGVIMLGNVLVLTDLLPFLIYIVLISALLICIHLVVFPSLTSGHRRFIDRESFLRKGDDLSIDIEDINPVETVGAKVQDFLKILCFGYIERIQTHPFKFGSIVMYIVVAAIIGLATQGLCFAGAPYSLSTRMTRLVSGPTCTAGAPCHVYITLPEAASSSVFVNFQTKDPNSDYFWEKICSFLFAGYVFEPPRSANPQIYYDKTAHPRAKTLSEYASSDGGKSLYFWRIEDPRHINWIELTGLTPNTTYYFRVGVGSDMDMFTPEMSFKVPPEDSVRFMDVGDMGVTKDTIAMAQEVPEYAPDVMLIGGDIAYSNGLPTCYQRWDAWFTEVASQFVYPTSQQLIPMLLSIGNHEAGGYNRTMWQAPFYAAYFPQTDEPSTEPYTRKSYHVHKFGDNVGVFNLDSGHVSPVWGEQLSWIQSELGGDYKGRTNVMAYHNPAFPSSRDPENFYSADVRNAWANMFVDKKVTLALEHHDHTYKRTLMLGKDASEVKEDGMIYIGDGCFGVEPRTLNKAKYLDVSSSTRNFVIVEVSAAGANATAYSRSGEVLDNIFVQQRKE